MIPWAESCPLSPLPHQRHIGQWSGHAERCGGHPPLYVVTWAPEPFHVVTI